MFFIKTVLSTLLILCSILLQAQSFSTFQLPTPTHLSPLFNGPILGSKIFYGATPTNLDPNKPIVVYVHGFSSLGGSWFGSNNIYRETYQNGQNCAFVSMTRGEGMWKNGSLLAVMLDDITRRFGVNKVVIVAHSNGGKASEVAMFWHNRHNKVERVITLGTPFFGTELADLAETPGLSWIVNLIGLSGGTSTSTTYYMGGYVRPLLDNLSNNQPNKFINFGAWGYNSNGGTSVLTGNLLNALGSGSSRGGNDGVTPYWSSTRPGGHPQWVPGHGNPVSHFNHNELTQSSIIWSWLRPRFTTPLSNLRLDNSQRPKPVTTTINSGQQLLNSEDDQLTFVVEQDLRHLQLNILHRSIHDHFTLQRQIAPKTWVSLSLNLHQNKPTPLYQGYYTLADISTLAPGRYRLVSEAKFVAIVQQDKGVQLTFDNHHQFAFDKQPMFIAQLERAGQYDLSKAHFKAVISLKNDLQGRAVEEQVWIETAQLDETGRVTFVPSASLPIGVYNLVLHAQHPEFQKTLVTGFVIRQNKTHTKHQTPSLQAYPNPAADHLFVNIDNKTPVMLRLYGLQGNVLYEQQITSVGKQQVFIDLIKASIVQGTYFVEIIEGTKKQTTTVVVAPQ